MSDVKTKELLLALVSLIVEGLALSKDKGDLSHLAKMLEDVRVIARDLQPAISEVQHLSDADLSDLKDVSLACMKQLLAAVLK